MTDAGETVEIDADELERLRERNRGLEQRNEHLEGRLDALQRQLAWLKREVFSSKSERRHALDTGAATGELFAKPPAGGDETDDDTETVTYTRSKPSGKDRGRAVTEEGLRFDADVPVETIDVAAPELEGADADDWTIIDYKITHRLAQRPGSYVVLAYRRPVVRHNSAETVTTPPAPANVLEGSIADASWLAGLLVDKFVYHQPLYRQHQRLADAGIQVSRATLSQLADRAIDLVAPIAEAQHGHIRKSATLAMDETPIEAGRNKAKAKMAQGWFWPIYGDADEISFTYARHRGARHVHEQLVGFNGTLISDGHSAYKRFAEDNEGVTHAQCWAHTRRQFITAEQAHPQAVGEALEHIRGLYEVEAAIRDRRLAPDKALAYRLEHGKPRVDAFFDWVYDKRQDPTLTPSDPLAKAPAYAHQREAALRVYLADGRVPIDTNHLERALRVVPMGRKNWHFCWNEAGARRVGIIQSLLTTCRLHHISPYTYLVDVLQRVGDHPNGDVISLTPRVWKQRFADAPQVSDVQRALH